MRELPAVLNESPRSARDAIAWVRQATRWIGPGFHPEDHLIQGAFGLTTEQAELLNQGLDTSYSLLNEHGRDPCEVAIKVQRRLLGFPRPAA
jgi:hypothetical protein